MFAIFRKTCSSQVILITGFKIQGGHVIEHHTYFAMQYLQRAGKNDILDLILEFVVEFIQEPVNSIHIKHYALIPI